MRKVNLNLVIPMNKEELIEAVEKVVGLIREDFPIAVTIPATYRGIYNGQLAKFRGGYEFINQALIYNKRIDDFLPEDFIESIVIPDEKIKFRRRGIFVPREISGQILIYHPNYEDYTRLVQLLTANNAWEKPFSVRSERT